ncbi:alpha/beta-hydrolase [Melanomma pulvis-pyrius CBS 109.77]|uniref:Alpha/beta-hydrolase n=1 Tax=Melanomma pulvis-pyrius CBS 109.77 TaxID=1314802 RepID=A0A6A6XU14_9PLEO|nr:alpha/beta-hydrolase [Melanomma pulvis-pyrius CBS 109.77]
MVEFILINGASLAYTITDNDTSKPLFVTLHGGRGFGDHKSDSQAYSPLSNQCRVLSFDFRGHGQSSRTGPYTFAQIVEDVEGIRRHFTGVESKFILCGGSFGGYIAQQYAISYPSNLSHLILRGTAPSYHHETEAIDILKTRLHKAPGMSVNMLQDKIFGKFDSDLEFQLVMHAAAPLYSENFDADSALRKCLATVYFAESHNELYSSEEKFFDYRNDLPKITAKTLVIVGNQDWICPPKQSHILASGIPGARLQVFENANHSVHLEKNAAVLAAVRKHLT